MPGTKGNTVVLQILDKEGKMGAVEVLDRSEISSNEVEFRVDVPTKLTAVVKGPDGSPLEGLRVGLTQYFGWHGEGAGSATTDARGEAVLDGLWKGGIYSLGVQVKDLTAPTPNFRVDGEGWTGRIEINLEPAARTQMGFVIDAAGKPVAKAWVHASALNIPQTYTDAHGRFTLTGLPNAPAKILASGSRFRGEATASPDRRQLVIRLDGRE